MTVGKVIQKQRVALGLKQSYLAMLLEVTVQTLSKWERDLTEPKASQVHLLSKFLYVSEKHICSGGSFIDLSDSLLNDLDLTISYIETLKRKYS
jgi:transcriptional regulator with XRE-family HTH domain